MNQIAPINIPQRTHFPIPNESNQSNTVAKRTTTAKRLANTKTWITRNGWKCVSKVLAVVMPQPHVG